MTNSGKLDIELKLWAARNFRGDKHFVKKKDSEMIARVLNNKIVGTGFEDPAKILANLRNSRSHSAAQKATLPGCWRKSDGSHKFRQINTRKD